MKDIKERMSRRGTLPAHTGCVLMQFMLFHVSIKTRQQNQIVRRKIRTNPRDTRTIIRHRN